MLLSRRPTLTGAMADHRLSWPRIELEQFARELQNNSASKIASIVAHDLRAHAGRSVVLAGEFEARAIHDAARQLNDSSGISAGPLITSRRRLVDVICASWSTICIRARSKH